MSPETVILLESIAEEAVEIIPELLRCILQGKPDEAARHARRAALAHAAKLAIETPVKK